ncbi:hypothetical protein [Acinetobacter sp. ANC 3832]|uniref:hypothetical protein n=1 Tax=Acinetobacter sp. ANC 3832 TaxID=1977874 RepID=UPI000A359050|nr:hypothetical protein [Acinetobacter sp. ANC 3832]OTG93887.1 hypothetical protein B9T35_09325 [Acinetobacter sp. ANC 3832]
MKIFIKSILLGTILSISGFTLMGCSSGLDPNTFSAEINVVDASNWWSGNGTATVLSIRSNVAYQVDVSNVTINNGQCRYEGYRRKIQYPQSFKMGQTLQLKLTGCNSSNVVQVDVETTAGTASYRFN